MDIQKQFQRDETLKREEVQKIQEWLQSQPHLPYMTEQEISWFLKSCYSSIEAAKITIDNFFTIKTLCPESLRNRDITRRIFQDTMKILVFSILPEKNPEGHTVVLSHFLSDNAEDFNFNEAIKLFDMVIMLDIFKNGTPDGLRCCFDVKGFTLGHLAKLGIISMKKFLYYLQEGMPVRLKGLHFINTTSIMDKVLQLMKPFLKKEILEVLYLHQTVHEMDKFIPVRCLPADYGGKYDSFANLHDAMKRDISENTDFFNHQDSQLVDETKRPGKPKNANDIFGVEGTFRKLDLD